MNLSSENVLAYLNAGKISVTAREYLQTLIGYSAFRKNGDCVYTRVFISF
jgi:hypothetical protein